MEVPYSSLPHRSSNPTLHPSPIKDTSVDITLTDKDTCMSRRPLFTSWASALWAPVVHFILSVGITILVLFYIDGHHFNLTERSPLVNINLGKQVTPFLLTQSDIVTIISSMVAISKFALTVWAASLCWNVALFLMERRGLARRHFEALIRWGLLALGVYSSDWSASLIGALLIASLVASLSAPILTGSIAWAPSNRLVHGLSINPFSFDDTVDGTLVRLSQTYYDTGAVRANYILSSAGLVGLGWGRDTEKGVAKRVESLIGGLSVNSTFENVTLPYFQVHSIRWIENRDEIPTIRDNGTMLNLLAKFQEQFDNAPDGVYALPLGSAILVPNIITNWSSDPLESTIIHDTRLLYLSFGYNKYLNTQDLPFNTYTLVYEGEYSAFAWVTFSAGVGRCKQHTCILSTPSAIRNNTPIELEPHQLTFQALSMAPVVGVNLITQNVSVPYMWDNIDDYVEAVLVRSYSAAWSVLNSAMQPSTALSEYVPSVPSLLASVHLDRVYAWSGIQLLVTLLSIVFLMIYSRLSRYSFVSSPSLTAFYLDTTEIPRSNTDSSIYEARKIEQRGDRLMVKVE